MNGHNLTMLTDLYQLTMVNGYFKTGTAHRVAVFDLFFRRLPWGNGYALAAGLEQVIEYLRELRFTADDLAYLRSLQLFSEEFLDYLGQMRFTGDIDAVVEGTPVFPGEPLVRVRAPIAQAQLLETTIANIINHQTLIATKAARVMEAAGDTKVMEFGLRRAQGPDAGLYGSRAAFIGGCQSTSNVLAGQLYDIPVAGTHAHSWVMSFPDELTAFRAYAKAYPHACLLLVDTYDTIRSGVPNAIRVAKELEAGTAMACLALAPSIWWFGTGYFIYGLFAAALAPSAACLIATKIPEEFRGRAYGVQQSAGMLGGLIGPIAAGWVGDRFGLNYIFIFTGAVSLVGSLCLLQLFRHIRHPVDKKAEDHAKSVASS
jgi:hypothetical protein